MKQSEKNTSDIGLGIASVLERADHEIRLLKKASISPKSKYWRPTRQKIVESTKIGIKMTASSDEYLNLLHEFNEAFEYFCKRTVNTKGQKVNRKHLSNKINDFKFGRNS